MEPTMLDMPTVPKEIALAALRGFTPYSDNPKKQIRYKLFLEHQAGLKNVELKASEVLLTSNF
jgi:hypothetical protein